VIRLQTACRNTGCNGIANNQMRKSTACQVPVRTSRIYTHKLFYEVFYCFSKVSWHYANVSTDTPNVSTDTPNYKNFERLLSKHDGTNANDFHTKFHDMAMYLRARSKTLHKK
jgi:hypothetical protein